jgi:hypothetical protein
VSLPPSVMDVFLVSPLLVNGPSLVKVAESFVVVSVVLQICNSLSFSNCRLDFRLLAAVVSYC